MGTRKRKCNAGEVAALQIKVFSLPIVAHVFLLVPLAVAACRLSKVS